MTSLRIAVLASRLAFLFFVLGLVTRSLPGQDVVEFLNGSKIEGKILEIRKTDKEFDFTCQIAGQQVQQTIAYAKVHAVTFGGKRFVLTPMEIQKNSKSSASQEDVERSPREVLQIISTVGASNPDWLSETRLNHPQSLDLQWPLKAEGPWNESKNVGQYIWGRVNPNTSRWKPGIKLVYKCMELHTDSPSLLLRDMEKLGVMYFQLLQDYERAAYWLQKARVDPSKPAGIHLCECYWRLGSTAMAMKQLDTRQLHFDAIKLFGDMGEVEKALSVAKVYERTNFFNEACINAGDALRSAGRLDEAVAYYQKVLDRNQARNEDYLKRFTGRAAEAIEAIRLFDRADVSRVANGTYSASATGYNGQLAVKVEVKDGRIADVQVTKHQEKQFYAALTDTPQQILDKQGIQNIDGTSGATITSQAIVNATARAMSKGTRN